MKKTPGETMPDKGQEDPEQYSRGYFLSLLIAFMGGLLSLTLGGLGLGYFFSPAWRKKKDGWVELGPMSAIPEHKPLKMDYILRRQDGWITLEGRNSVWLLREGAVVTAFSPSCTHLGCAYRWDEPKQSFLCPCHTAVFSKTGEVVSGPPPRGLDRFQTKIEGGALFILPKEKTA